MEKREESVPQDQVPENENKVIEEAGCSAKKGDDESAYSGDAATDIVQDSPGNESPNVAVISEVQSPSSQASPLNEESKNIIVQQKSESPVAVIEAKIETTASSTSEQESMPIKMESKPILHPSTLPEVSQDKTSEPIIETVKEFKPEDTSNVEDSKVDFSSAVEETKLEEPSTVEQFKKEESLVDENKTDKSVASQESAEGDKPVECLVSEGSKLEETLAQEELKMDEPLVPETKLEEPLISGKSVTDEPLIQEEPKTEKYPAEKPVIPAESNPEKPPAEFTVEESNLEEPPAEFTVEESRPEKPVSSENPKSEKDIIPDPKSEVLPNEDLEVKDIPVDEPQALEVPIPENLAEELTDEIVDELTQKESKADQPSAEETKQSLIPEECTSESPNIESTLPMDITKSTPVSPVQDAKPDKLAAEVTPIVEGTPAIPVETEDGLTHVESKVDTPDKDVTPVSAAINNTEIETPEIKPVTLYVEDERKASENDEAKSPETLSPVENPKEDNEENEKQVNGETNGYEQNGEEKIENQESESRLNGKETNGPNEVATLISWKNGGSQVAVSGDFNEWEDNFVMNKQDDVFSTKVKLSKGKHYVKFFVDGEWTVDDSQPTIELEGHGKVNVLTVSAE